MEYIIIPFAGIFIVITAIIFMFGLIGGMHPFSIKEDRNPFYAFAAYSAFGILLGRGSLYLVDLVVILRFYLDILVIIILPTIFALSGYKLLVKYTDYSNGEAFKYIFAFVFFFMLSRWKFF